jgi:hypothetical protein
MVGEIGRGQLVGGHAVALELLQALMVPGGAEREDVLRLAMVEGLEQLLVGQLEAGEQVKRILGAEIGAGIVRRALVR